MLRTSVASACESSPTMKSMSDSDSFAPTRTLKKLKCRPFRLRIGDLGLGIQEIPIGGGPTLINPQSQIRKSQSLGETDAAGFQASLQGGIFGERRSSAFARKV